MYLRLVVGSQVVQFVEVREHVVHFVLQATQVLVTESNTRVVGHSHILVSAFTV